MTSPAEKVLAKQLAGTFIVETITISAQLSLSHTCTSRTRARTHARPYKHPSKMCALSLRVCDC